MLHKQPAVPLWALQKYTERLQNLDPSLSELPPSSPETQKWASGCQLYSQGIGQFILAFAASCMYGGHLGFLLMGSKPGEGARN